MSLIIRHRGSQRRFTQVANDAARDERLSLRARGLLTLLLSHTDGWDTSERRLAEQCREGRHSIRKALNELEGAGYLHRHQVRDEDGTMGSSVWDLTDEPRSAPWFENQTTAETADRRGRRPWFDSPTADEPTTAQPTAVNPTTKNTNGKNTNGKKSRHQQLFNALAEACGWDLSELPSSAGGRLGKAAKELVEIGATPADVHAKAKAYRSRWPDIDLTPQGLTGNWAQVEAETAGTGWVHP